MRSNIYQIALIAAGLLVTAFFGVFLWREVFPEYKIYQEAYVALEDFRSTYTHLPPPNFQYGIKQVLMEKPDKGNPEIDRCVTCHVALEFSHFSPTKIAKDINGNTIYNADGTPLQIPNEDYVWGRLDQKIASLLDPTENERLEANGEASKVQERLKQAEKYQALKTAHVGHETYDMTKVLTMHPLIGRETRPFEFHPIDQFGCVSCHNGNGRALTTPKAHGPVFDGTYETEFVGDKPEFLERDPANDPKFAKVFNHKPGHELIFQTTPLFVGGLIEAKCVQCHQPSSAALSNITFEANTLFKRRNDLNNAFQQGLNNEKQAVITTLTLWNGLKKKGLEKTLKELQASSLDYTLPPQDREARANQLNTLQVVSKDNPKDPQKAAEDYLQKELVRILGSENLIDALNQAIAKEENLDTFIQQNAGKPQATGSLFKKWEAVRYAQELAVHANLAQLSLQETVKDTNTVEALTSDVDALLKTYKKGYSLYLTQACYACHRIAGMARGGIGPELTNEGTNYPWFIKESIVWPQADVKTSTMPNFHLDHEELEALVTFLLAQNGQNKAVSDTAYKIAIKEWESGRKNDWEKPVSPEKIQDVRYGMTIFAAEGCASCHRLQGYESNVGFKVEKDNKADFDAIYKEKEWFQALIPETISAKRLTKILSEKSAEIDKRIDANVRKNSILEEIEAHHPGLIESMYPAFKYAARAKNSEYEKIPEAAKKLKEWKDRVHNVLMIYVQEYGLGRIVGPRPNWSGVFRTDAWLMEHFRNPAAYSPKSIMPTFPFDDTKFYALTYMLDVVGRKNRDAVHAIWKARGFNPEQAYEIHCSQCHGPFRLGNGPVAEWIYPLPKNLRDPDFMRNLTPERTRESIHMGVIGTPMPPWGVAAKDKMGYDGIPVLSDEQISLLTDWLFNQIPGGTVIRSETDTPKWEYKPSDVIQELKKEGGESKIQPKKPLGYRAPLHPRDIIASLQPMVAASTKSNVDEYFDVYPNDIGIVDKNKYYIKEKYYTPENLAAGKAFFEVHCAACHGKEADGSGERAEAMHEAKPRMLINLNWLNTRDDLRLLRSIKYGVPGTAMTPWGDQTTSLKRMQLVMYIRSLNQQAEKREQLLEALYNTYDRAVQIIDLANKDSAASLTNAKKAYQKSLLARREADLAISKGEMPPEKAYDLYKKELEASRTLHQREAYNSLFDTLRANVLKEKELMSSLGNTILSTSSTEPLLTPLLQVIDSEKDNYTLDKGKLLIQTTGDSEIRQKQLANIKAEIEKNIAALDQQIQQIHSKTDEAVQEQKELQTQKQNLEKLKNKILTVFEELSRIEENQAKVYKSLSLNKEKSS